MEEQLREAKAEVRKGGGSLTGNKDMHHEGRAESASDQAVGKVQGSVRDLTGDAETEMGDHASQVEGHIERAG